MYTTLHFRNYKATIVLSWIRVCFCARFVCFFFNESASRLMKRFNKIKQKKFHKNEYRWVTFDALNSQCQYFKEVFQILILINRRYQKKCQKKIGNPLSARRQKKDLDKSKNSIHSMTFRCASTHILTLIF